jgi:hypothetical protein
LTFYKRSQKQFHKFLKIFHRFHIQTNHAIAVIPTHITKVLIRNAYILSLTSSMKTRRGGKFVISRPPHAKHKKKNQKECKQNAKSASPYLRLMFNARNKSLLQYIFAFKFSSFDVLLSETSLRLSKCVYEVNPASVVLYLNVNQFKPVRRRCNFSTRNEHHLWYVMILFCKL